MHRKQSGVKECRHSPFPGKMSELPRSPQSMLCCSFPVFLLTFIRGQNNPPSPLSLESQTGLYNNRQKKWIWNKNYTSSVLEDRLWMLRFLFETWSCFPERFWTHVASVRDWWVQGRTKQKSGGFHTDGPVKLTKLQVATSMVLASLNTDRETNMVHCLTYSKLFIHVSHLKVHNV